MKKKVMIFGVFDGLHDGHLFFIEEAKKLGTELIISVARDETVRALKSRDPIHKLEKRMEDIRNKFPNTLVIAGDLKLSSWEGVLKHEPQIIALGHDQTLMKEDLEKEKHLFKQLESLVIVKDYNRDTLSSTLLRSDM